MFLLDTCVISHLRRPQKSNPHVLAWATGVAAVEQYISAITILELEQGVLAKERTDPVQGLLLRRWMDNVVRANFAGRIIAFDEQSAMCCAFLHVPNPKSYRDAMIGATAMTRGMTVVTENTKDFVHMVDADGASIKLHNPWL